MISFNREVIIINTQFKKGVLELLVLLNVKNEDITMGKALLLKEITVSPDKLFFENDEIELGNIILKVITILNKLIQCIS